MYSSPSHQLTLQALNEIAQQLPPPFLIQRELNGHNRIRGSRTNSARGNIIEEFMNTNNFSIMNDGSLTRITATTESAIVLSICSPILQIDKQ